MAAATKTTDERCSRAQIQELITLSNERAQFLFDQAIKQKVQLRWADGGVLAQALRDAARAAVGLKPIDTILPKHLGAFHHLIGKAKLAEGMIVTPELPPDALGDAPAAQEPEVLPAEGPQPPPAEEAPAEAESAGPVAVVPQASRPSAVVASVAIDRGLAPSNMDELYRAAKAVHVSGLAPKSLKTAEACFVAMATGLELGLKPMAAMRAIYVVNGMPALKGEAAVALIRNSGKCRFWRPRVEGKGDERVGIIRSMRTDSGDELETRFTVEQAKAAGLWGKKSPDGRPSPWVTFPERMLVWRAIGHHASDYYSDVTLGCPLLEIARDLPVSIEAEERSEPPAEADPLLSI